MGWASGSSLAEELWDELRPLVSAKNRIAVARAVIDCFEDNDCDTIDEAEKLCKDAGRKYDYEREEMVWTPPRE